jgi:hypothetical protein
MKLFKLLAVLLLTCAAFGQGAAARYDNFTWSTTNVQGTAVLAAIPGASVAVCSFPATGLPCSNLATLYTDSTLATACTGSNGCSNPIVSDSAGNFGFWAVSGHYQYTVSFGGFNYGPYDLTAAPFSATSKSYVDTATRASVIAYGAVGNGVADDTTAFQNAINGSRSVFIPNNPTPGACYVVNGLTFVQSTTIEWESRNTCVTVKTSATPYGLFVSGASIASPVATVNIIGNGGILYAGRTMNAGTAGIKINYGSHISISNLIVNGFYDNIFVDNTFYLDLDRVQSNGGTNSNLWYQHSDVSHGPYFGGPLNIRGGTYDSGPGPWGIHITDVAGVNMDGADVTGYPNGTAAYFSSSNGIPATPPDYAQGLHITNNIFDSSANEELRILNYVKSSVSGNWFSGGRTNSLPCVTTNATQDISVTGNTFFNCGSDGLAIGGAPKTPSLQTMVTGNSFSGSPGDGVHVVFGQFTTVVGNTCTSTAFSGNGQVQPFCVYEEPTSMSNTYVGNDGTGTTFGNSYLGSGVNYIDSQQGFSSQRSVNATGPVAGSTLSLTNDPQVSPAGACSFGGNTYTPSTAAAAAGATNATTVNCNGTLYQLALFPVTGGGTGNPSWWPSIPGTATTYSNLQASSGNPGTWTVCNANNNCSAGTSNGLGATALTFCTAGTCAGTPFTTSKSGAPLLFSNTTAAGTVTVSGTAVTWTGGTKFNSGWANQPITINGASKTISATAMTPAGCTTACTGMTITTSGTSGAYSSTTGFNTLVYRHLGSPGVGLSGITNMLEDTWVYVTPGSGPGYEFDPDFEVGTTTSTATEYKGSFACYVSGGGKWNVYDTLNHAWVASTYTCNWNTAGANAWHHIQLWISFNQGAKTYTYQGLAIDGADVWTPSSHGGLTSATYSACPPNPVTGCSNTPLGNNVNIEFQTDNDSSSSTSLRYDDKITLVVW